MLGLACLFVISATVGCGVPSEEAVGPEASGDDIQASDLKARTQDLFQPAESALVGTAASTTAGLATWKIYQSDKGITVRGISATNKIKVVYAIALDSEAKDVRIRSAGYVKASDYALPDDAKAALAELGAAIKKDLGIEDGIGTRAESCRSPGLSVFITAVGGALTVGGAAVVGNVCLATGGAGCVLGGMVLAIIGTSAVIENMTSTVCSNGR